ncbi:Jouberin [Harpegnathos saltator]|uniref:Jouberin n=1 Tax=Harpegnathos saltator TaxID=610380 RepID=E2BG00_HARSA|nr:Jouberin [Harpegnathos saltator]
MASKGRMLKRSRHVSSFLEDSMENTTPSKATMNVVVDIHHEASRSQGDNENVPVVPESSDEKAVKRSDSFKSSSKRASEVPGDRHVVVTRTRLDETRDRVTLESFDLIEEIGTPGKNSRTPELEPFPEVKPRRRKQWSTVNAASETEDNSKRQPRKRWSKDTSVIRLPETRDVSPLTGGDEDQRKPIPAPRSSVRRNAFFFDNPAFVSENEEVLRIETDHRRESTKIEMRRMSDRSSKIEDIEEVRTSGGTSSDSLKKSAQGASARSRRERLTDSDARSARTSRSSKSRNNSSDEVNSTSSLGKVTDIQSSSTTYKETSTSTSDKQQPEATQDRSLRKRERSLLRKKDVLTNDDKASSSAKDARSNADAETDTRVRKKKRKKRRQGKEDKQDKEKDDKREDAEIRYISVTVHRTDLLEVDYAKVKRPMVKVHIVNAHTGSYLKCGADNSENTSVSLQPMITGKFDFKENRSMIPVWEEELIFEHDFNAITRRDEDSQVVILFEVIDPLSFAEASFSSEGCWHKIAWAFLKPLGCNDTLHTDKKVRLQLYKPRRSFKKYDRRSCEVYTWWQSNNRCKYPSSLFVTVTSVSPPKIKPVLYQQLTMKHVPDTWSESQERSNTRISTAVSLPKWARLAAQSCKIPNERVFETEASENGCFYVAFSSDGKYLACVHSEEYSYPIVVYEVESGKTHVRFSGHKTFVYSLSWSSDDRCLLSASADQTARIWDVRNRTVQYVEMLPHPTYVYCAKYGPSNTTIVATGCYDRVARVWAYDKRSRKRVLCQELEGHEGFVNSMVFYKNGDLITADSVGAIIVWSARRNSKMPSKREWCIARKIKVREIEGVVINTIALHPLESRLLVHSRNSGLRTLDLATCVVLQRYDGLNNQRIQTKACISPCGSLVLCGGEDSVLNVWHLETSEHLAKYTSERDYRAVTCVDYHPYDHVLAYSGFGGPTAVRVLRFNKNTSNKDIGLTIISEAGRISKDGNNTTIHPYRDYISRYIRRPWSSSIYSEQSRALLAQLDFPDTIARSIPATAPILHDMRQVRRELDYRTLYLIEMMAETPPRRKLRQFNLRRPRNPEPPRHINYDHNCDTTMDTEDGSNLNVSPTGRNGQQKFIFPDIARLRLDDNHDVHSTNREHDLPLHLRRDVTHAISETSGSETSRERLSARNRLDTCATRATGYTEDVETGRVHRFADTIAIDMEEDVQNSYAVERAPRSESSPDNSGGTFVISRK